jgi:hypothetical protein
MPIGSAQRVAATTFNGGSVEARVKRCLHIVSQAADLVIRLRDKPRFIDYFALGVRFLDVASQIRDEVLLGAYTNPFDYFNSDSNWQLLPTALTGLIFPHVRNREKKTLAEKGQLCAWEGRLGSARVGWLAGEDGKSFMNMSVYGPDREKLTDELRTIVWKNVGGPHAVLSAEDGVVTDRALMPTIISTELVQQLSERVSAFHAAGDVRSYLVHGEPGTGKTTAIQHVAHATGLRVLRVPLVELQSAWGTLQQQRTGPMTDFHVPFDLLVEIFQPDVLVADDVDRSSESIQNALLEFMQKARHSVKIIIASANHLEALTPALQRPERFDDHVAVPPLERGMLEGILGTEREVAGELVGWPIVYVLDYLRRVKVLGRKRAREEIPAMAKRVVAARETSAGPEERLLAKMIRRQQ